LASFYLPPLFLFLLSKKTGDSLHIYHIFLISKTGAKTGDSLIIYRFFHNYSFSSFNFKKKLLKIAHN